MSDRQVAATLPRRGPGVLLRGAGLVWVLVAVAAAGALHGQSDSDRPAKKAPREMAVHLYTLENQRAIDALQWVLPMISDEGSVELRPGGNTLVIREHRSKIDSILDSVRRFDHEPQEVALSLWLVRALPGVPVSPPGVIDPQLQRVPEVVERLRDYLHFESYTVLGANQARGAEGDFVTFELDSNYTVKFRLGTVLALKRIPLEGFEVLSSSDGGPSNSLMRSHLNLWVDRPLVLALSSSESSALLIVVRGELVGNTSGKR